MIDVSIVIPVYNCEKYIEQCIKSVQNQTIKTIEILCIVDGSRDNSERILRKLASEDRRIIIICQDNRGAGAARNVGIKTARGKYIAFLDADDYYLDPVSLQRMIDTCKEYQVDACGSIMYHWVAGKEYKTANSQEVLNIAKRGIVEYSEYQFDYNYTTFLFSRKQLVENEIFFPEYSFFEDPPFLVRALNQINEFVMTDIALYCYRLSPVSLKFSKKKCIDLLKGLRDNMLFSIEHRLDILFTKTLNRIEYEYYDLIYNNLVLDELDGLRLLMDINELVQKREQYNNYIIRPLKALFRLVSESWENYEKTLVNEIKSANRIFIFGAGTISKRFYYYLKGKGLSRKIEAFLISADSENQFIDTTPVLSISEVLIEDGDKIIIAVSRIFIEEIVNVLYERGLQNYSILDVSFIDQVD